MEGDEFVRAVPLLLLLIVAGAGVPSIAAAQGSPMPARPAPAGGSSSSPMTPPASIFLGGVPTGTKTADAIRVTVVDAIQRALDHNLGVLTAEQEVGRAEGARWRMLSELLPNVNGRVSETREKLNLAAFGFGPSTGGPFADIPSIVGPFNVFDARIYLSQSVFDLGAINDARSHGHDLAAARYMYQGSRDFVIHVAATLYIQALAA